MFSLTVHSSLAASSLFCSIADVTSNCVRGRKSESQSSVLGGEARTGREGTVRTLMRSMKSVSPPALM